MKKYFKRICSTVVAVSMLLAMTVLVASAEEALTITDVAYGEKYTATTATEKDWINSPSASTNIVEVTLSDGTVLKAAEGCVYTLVVDGVQYDILDYLEKGTPLTGDWALYETTNSYAYSEFAKFMNMGGNTAQYTYRAALTIENNEVVTVDSIEALYKTVEVTGAAVKGGKITSMGAFFNGIIVKGSSEVTISGTEFDFIGDGANDFQGEAAVVLAEDTSSVTLDGVYIHTAGVIRTGAAVKENGKLYIKNSVIFTEESQDTQEEYDALVVPMMKRTPFALGLEGVVRATNVLGSGQGIYSDSIIVSTGWGALSTDSGKGGVEALNVNNVLAGIGDIEVAVEGKDYTATKTVNGVTYGYTMKGSGYVAYADAGVIDIFNNVEFYSPQYIQIMASSTSSAYYTNSKLTSGAVAVMTQQNNGGTISIKDSTVNVADTLVQIKSGAANIGYTNIVLDNTEVNFTADNLWGGVLIELVESDDAGNPGNTTFPVNDYGDEYSLADALENGTIEDTNATLKNGDYAGDIYNNIYYKYQALNVSLENANLTGTVSSSYGYHVDDEGNRIANGTVLTAATSGDYRVDPLSGDYIKIGAQVNVVDPVDANPINLTIDADSTWTVGEVNYLNTLTLATADSLKGEGTVYVSELTIGGEAVADGEYTYGGVKVVVDFNDEMAEALEASGDNGLLADTQDYAGNAFQIKIVDQDGNNAARYVSAIDTFKMNADGTVSFSIVGVEGYTVEVVEIKAGEGITMHDCTQGMYDYGFTVTPVESEGGDAGMGGGDMGQMPGGDMGGMPGGDMGGGMMPGGDMGGMGGTTTASVPTVTVVIKYSESTQGGGEMPDMPDDGEGGGNGNGDPASMVSEYTVNEDGTVTLTLSGLQGMDTYDVNGVACGAGDTITVTPVDGKVVVSFTGGGGPNLGLVYTIDVNEQGGDQPGDKPAEPAPDQPGDKPAEPAPEDPAPETPVDPEPEQPEGPQTGDVSVMLYVVLATIATVSLAGVVVLKKKEQF